MTARGAAAQLRGRAVVGAPWALAAATIRARWPQRGARAAGMLAVLVCALVAAQPTPSVEIADADAGRALLYLPLADDSLLRLAYVHSIYREPVWEEFRLRDGGFDLVGLRSHREAVLEYYARAEPIVREPGQYAIHVAAERHAELPLLATALGERTLHYAGQQVALHGLAGEGARVRLRVAQPPRLVAWLTRPPCLAWPCP